MDPVGRLTKEKQKKIEMVIVYGQDTILKINKEFNNKYTITYIYLMIKIQYSDLTLYFKNFWMTKNR